MKPSEKLTISLVEAINKVRDFEKRPFNLAISGGNSPVILFTLWSGKYRDEIDWANLRIFWVDERCVPHDSPESNFGMAKTLLLDKVSQKPENIFPINGTLNPADEALRYERQLQNYAQPGKTFDMVILGIGDDGHTSSIFPGQEELLKTERIYLESVNPYSNQKRVALTASGILRSDSIVFYLSGESKQYLVSSVLNIKNEEMYPVSEILRKAHFVNIYWDETQNIADLKFNSIFANKMGLYY